MTADQSSRLRRCAESARVRGVASEPALVDLLVLRALSWTPMHGFEIVSWLERAGGGSLELEDSALYQAVYRLEERGLLQAEWGVTENNRRARYYKITTAGRAHLRAETKNWVEYADTVTTILTAKSIP